MASILGPYTGPRLPGCTPPENDQPLEISQRKRVQGMNPLGAHCTPELVAKKKAPGFASKCLFLLVRPRGFEPLTYGFVVRRSIRLSYGRVEEECLYPREPDSSTKKCGLCKKNLATILVGRKPGTGLAFSVVLATTQYGWLSLESGCVCPLGVPEARVWAQALPRCWSCRRAGRPFSAGLQDMPRCRGSMGQRVVWRMEGDARRGCFPAACAGPAAAIVPGDITP